MSTPSMLRVLLCCAFIMTSAAAYAVDTPINYTLTTADPVLAARPGGSAVPCDPNSAGAFRYRTTVFTVSVTGAYALVDQRATSPALSDGVVAVYAPSFNAANPQLNCLGAFDDNNFGSPLTINLTAGTSYTLLETVFDPDATLGNYLFIASGPGSVAVGGGVPAVITPVPTMSAWGALTTVLVLFGVGAWQFRRRRA